MSWLGALGGIISGIAGLAGNRSAGRGMSQANAYTNQGLQGLSGIGRDLRGLYGGALQGGMFDTDRQIAKMNALSHKQEGIEGRSAVGALVGAGYKPGDSVFSDTTRAVAADNATRRDQEARDINLQNLMARLQILQGSQGPFQGLIQGGLGQFQQQAGQQQSLAGLIPGLAQSLGDLFKGIK